MGSICFLAYKARTVKLMPLSNRERIYLAVILAVACLLWYIVLSIYACYVAAYVYCVVGISIRRLR